MPKSPIVVMAVLVALVPSVSAEARCGSPYAGPLSTIDPAYLYSSSCKATSADRVQLSNQICSVTAGEVPFFWDKLNWASGSQGIRSGQCLVLSVLTKAAHVIDVPGSTIRLYGDVDRSEATSVFISGLGGDPDSIEKSIDRTAQKDGGIVKPLHFKIAFSARGKDRVSIRAGIQGTNSVFYIYLPPKIKTEGDLRSFITPDYFEKIRRYISFGDTNERIGSNGNDPVIADYRRRNEMTGRARIGVSANRDDISTIDFEANANVNDVVAAVRVCIGESNVSMICL